MVSGARSVIVMAFFVRSNFDWDWIVEPAVQGKIYEEGFYLKYVWL
jgi:hypothetical protein